MKLQKHTLQNNISKHGEGAWSRVLFSPLREHATEPEIKRVEKVLGLLVAADTRLREHNKLLFRPIEGLGVPGFLDHHRKVKDAEFAYRRTLDALNVALRRYRWGATVSGDVDGFRSELTPVTNSKSSWANWESVIVAMLLEGTKKPDELSRFRRCSQCQQWFYAIRGHQQFCGESCRRYHEAQDPEFKEKRRVYMRERYRPQQKDLQKRSLQIARRAGKGAK